MDTFSMGVNIEFVMIVKAMRPTAWASMVVDEPHKDDHPAVMYLGVFHRGYPEPGLFLLNDGLT